MKHWSVIKYSYDASSIFHVLRNIKREPITKLTEHEMRAVLPFLSSTPTAILFARLAGGYKSSIHIDQTSTGALITNAINLPLYNAGNVFQHWFEPCADILYLTGPGKHLIPSVSSGIEIDQALLDRPTVVNPSKFHLVQNLSANEAFLLSLRHS